MSISPDDFVAAWKGPLVTLPASGRVMGVDDRDIDFLLRAGLPPKVRYGQEGQIAASLIHASFRRLRNGLAKASEEPPVGVYSDYVEHVAFGNEWVEGGADFLLTIHVPSGRVELIDVERVDPRPVLLNTSVRHLAATLLAFRDWHRTRAPDDRSFARLRTALETADPTAWNDGHWSLRLSHFETVEVSTIVCDISNHDTGAN